MKQVLIFGFSLLLAAVAVGFLMRPEPATFNIQTLKESTSTDVFVLYKISGEVFFKKETDNNFSLLDGKSISLPNKTIVKTIEGKAVVLLNDKSVITLKENSEMKVALTDKGYSMTQFFGKTYHRVEALVSGRTYEVKTPSALAAVRGTKFAVSYDEDKKETKVSVTEHEVAVYDSNSMTSTTSPKDEEMILVKEGKTAMVKNLEIRKEGESFLILDTVMDKDMNEFIKNETDLDEVYDSMKQSVNKEELEKKIEMMFSLEQKNDEKSSTKNEVTDSSSIKKEESSAGNIAPQKNPTQKVSDPVVKKLGEEEFFSKFEPLFIRLFYVDDKDEICAFKGSPKERVLEVVALANESGYPLLSITKLTAFAEDIAKYCVLKDAKQKVDLQKRFEEEYPYQQ